MPTWVGNTSETRIGKIVYNKQPNNDTIAGSICSVISDHLIKFLVESSSYIHNSSKEKIINRCYKKFDKEKRKSDLGKVNWQKHCNDPDPNVFMEDFLKIVHMLLDRHAPFKFFNKKKTKMYSSKSWITSGTVKSIKVKDSLCKKFSSESNLLYGKHRSKTNLGPIRTIFPLSLDAQRTHITKDFEENKRNVKTVWKAIRELIAIKQRNDLPLTTL